MTLRLRVILNVLGQGLSSVSNLVLQLLFIATLSPRDFGWVVIGMAGVHLALAVARIGTGDVLLARRNAVGPSSRWLNRRLVAIGFANTVFAIALAFIVGSGPAVRPILIIGFASIPLMLQDGQRYRQWAEEHSQRVIALDASWLAVTLVPVGLAALFDQLSATLVALAWSGGAVASLCLVPLLGWAKDGQTEATDDDAATATGRSLLTAELPNAAAVHVTPVLLAILLTADAAGAYRAVLLPFMVAEMTLLAVRVAILPSLGPQSDDGGHEDGALRIATVLHGGTALALIVATGFALATPIRALLGNTTMDDHWLPAVIAASLMIIVRAAARPTVDWVALRAPLPTIARVRATLSAVELVAIAAVAMSGLAAVFFIRLVVNIVAAGVWTVLRRRQRPGDNTSVRTVRSTIRTSSVSD